MNITHQIDMEREFSNQKKKIMVLSTVDEIIGWRHLFQVVRRIDPNSRTKNGLQKNQDFINGTVHNAGDKKFTVFLGS
jgi:hypothetical protein